MNKIPSSLTQKDFIEWRSPRTGTANPQEMTNTLWQWLVSTRMNAYEVNELFKGPSSFDAGPCWTFDRLGQSVTHLPDGRTVFVAGEHEDYYDPDFYIYNDVVIVTPTGEVSIFGYPTETFPPTDFHSATLLNDALIIIGNLGYSQDRCFHQTQVLRLTLDTWQISRIETEGEAPGWINGHSARLSSSGSEIYITGGHIDRHGSQSLIENIEDWCLDTTTWRWKRMTHRPWVRFDVYRTDKTSLHLWQMRHLQWSRKVKWNDIEKQEHDLTIALGTLPDLTLLETLYTPALATSVPGEDPDAEYRTFRIQIDDVVIRYTEKIASVLMTVEGTLPHDVLTALKQDIIEKLSTLECCPVTCEEIQPQ